MKARIFQPARNAMQSGGGNSQRWVLQYAPAVPRLIDPLMGWAGSADTSGQVRLSFESKQAALDFAKRHGLEVTISEPKPRRHFPRGYGDNFSHNRKVPWSH